MFEVFRTALVHSKLRSSFQVFISDKISETGWLVDYAYDSTPPASIGWAEAALDLGYVSPAAINGPDIICHLNGTNAALSHTVAAGDTMDVFWSSWPDTHKGPVIDYLASCNGDCSTVDKTTLEYVSSISINNPTNANSPTGSSRSTKQVSTTTSGHPTHSSPTTPHGP